MTPIQIMIDIEALASPERLPPGSLVEVCQVGAVAFTTDTREAKPILDSLNLFPAAGNGLCDPDTAAFWMSMVSTLGLPEWHDHRCAKRTKPMPQCLAELAAFLGKYPGASVWAKNPAYDKVILAAHYAMLRVPCPFKKVLDVRTLQDWYQIKDEAPASHDALQDCLEQVGILIDAETKRMSA